MLRIVCFHKEKRIYTMSSMIKTKKFQSNSLNECFNEYPIERLKEQQSSLRLAQALHQKLHKEFDLVVNVRKLQRFIQNESTQLLVTSEGIIIESIICNESWCSTESFRLILDLGYIHDESIVSSALWLEPLQEGIFKSDPNLEEDLDMMALTFDDGPVPMTMKLVDILKTSNTKATFFLIGTEIELKPTMAKQLYDLGHEVGNHTYTHPHIPELSLEEITYEMNHTDSIIEEVLGFKPMIMRPPYGEINEESLRAFDHRVIQWSLDTVDWHHHDHVTILSILNQSIDGDIILMHDRYEHTHQAVESFIQHQLSCGVQFVSVSQLIELRHLKSRIVHGVRTIS